MSGSKGVLVLALLIVSACSCAQAPFDFVYRDPHFSSNIEDREYAAALGAHSVDNEWGLWGHNLKKVLRADAVESIYARQKGKVTKEQYCFSSDALYTQLETYVLDNYGDSKDYTQRFMIMPNDNEVVCDCAKCLSNGNTSVYATPALSVLLKRLAARFPYHQFFTSAYLTTLSPPKSKWPENTGVMISTIDIPKGIALDNRKETKRFLALLNEWKVYAPSVYIWDYAANFDDYLTPIPVLYGLQKQLAFYKSVGVKGVFLNANGYDYASFDDMKTYVVAHLMLDVNASVDKLCRTYFNEFYPVTGRLLTNYYLSLEKKFEKKRIPYNIYAGFDEVMNTYLEVDDFVAFYNALESMKKNASGNERERLEKLFIALSFTRLQIAYERRTAIYGFASEQDKYLVVRPEIEKILTNLSAFKRYKSLSNYKEETGELDLYIANWRKMLTAPLSNKLLGEPIDMVIGGNKRKREIAKLNDGVMGFAENYHQGWFVYDDDLHIGFQADAIKDAKMMTLSFLLDKKHRIYPPGQIYIFKNNKKYKEVKVTNGKQPDRPQAIRVEAAVDFSDAYRIDLKIIKRKGKGSFACDEIWLN